jgi:phosphatidylinositol alpha-mannosyltransferase
MRLRIGIVSQSYHPTVGGVTEHVDATARGLRARGHEVTIVTSRFAGNGHPEPGVVRMGRDVIVMFNGAENHMTVGLDLGRRLDEVLTNERFDVLHVHCPLSPVLPLLALRKARQPVVGTFHSAMSSDLPFRLFRPGLVRSYRRMDRVIAVSTPARDLMTRLFPGPIEVVPNGVDLGRFRPGLPRLARFDDGIPNVLFVGRFDPRKGLPDLMRAGAIAAEQGVPFRLILVGDGRLRGPIQRMARGPLAGRVHFEGQVGHSHLPRYYATADVFCSPARSGESFGLVLLEAMAAGVPVVATDLPGYRTVLSPGAEGIVVPPRDPLALAAALRRLLTDAALRAEMGTRGLATAGEYDWVRVVDRLEEIYRSLTGASSGPAARGDRRAKPEAREISELEAVPR